MNAVETGYQFETIPITPENRFQVMARVQPFHDQLALAKGRELGELYSNIDVGKEAVFAVSNDSEPKDLGVVVGQLRRVVLSGREYSIYIRLLRVVDKDQQQGGIGRAFTGEIVERLHPDGFEGRTPNPEIPRAGELSGYIGTIHPIHKLHSTETMALMAATLPENYKERLDFKTGRCKEVYPAGDEFRLFSLNNASKRVRRIYQVMTSPPIEADLKAGDGIVYFEWVKEEGLFLPPKVA